MIVALRGKAGSGKDTFAKVMVEQSKEMGWNATLMAFADPIKDFCGRLFEFTGHQLRGPSEAREVLDTRYGAWQAWVEAYGRLLHSDDLVYQVYRVTRVNRASIRAALMRWFVDLENETWTDGLGGLTPRRALQTFGTEFGRNVHEDIWAGLALGNAVAVVDMDPNALVIFTDCRFTNEGRKVRDHRGIVVKIVRPGLVSTDTHASENGMEERDCDWVVHNQKEIGDLTAEARNLIRSLEHQRSLQ